MRILFVTHSMRFGGAERVMSILLKKFAELGNDVSLILLDDEKIVAYELDERINTVFLCTPRFNSLNSIKNLFSGLKSAINQINPDVITSFFPAPLVFCWLATFGKKIPLVFSERNDPNNNIKGWQAKFFQAIALKKAKHIVFQTTGAQNCYGKKIRIKSSVIPNPFSSQSLPKAYVGERQKRIVSVGRLVPQKNQKILIEAFANVVKKHTDYILEIYGEGHLRNELEMLIEKYGLQQKVFLPGNSKQVLNDINGAALFAFSSDYEGMPNALIEAMALGLPSISTDCSPGGAREFINNYENGILIPCNDVSAMTEAMLFMLDNPQKAEMMGCKAKDVIENLSPEIIANKWIEVFDQVE